MPATRQELFALLDRLDIAHRTLNHVPVFTVEESAAVKEGLRGAHTKNLFLKDKSGRLFLICAEANTPIKINKLHPVLGCKRLSFGKPELLLKHLGVTPGSVTLFSVMNDAEKAVTLVIDKTLTDSKTVNFHPLLNDATTAISNESMLKFARATGHEPIVTDFTTLNAEIETPS